METMTGLIVAVLSSMAIPTNSLSCEAIIGMIADPPAIGEDVDRYKSKLITEAIGHFGSHYPSCPDCQKKIRDIVEKGRCKSKHDFMTEHGLLILEHMECYGTLDLDYEMEFMHRSTENQTSEHQRNEKDDTLLAVLVFLFIMSGAIKH